MQATVGTPVVESIASDSIRCLPERFWKKLTVTMYGYKFSRHDVQAALVRRAENEGVVHIIDVDGFIVVHSRAEFRRLELIFHEIAASELGVAVKECHSWSTDAKDGCQSRWYGDKRDENLRHDIPNVEYEMFGPPPTDLLARPDAAAVYRLCGMVMPKRVAS